jgi:hypothetical protein
VTADEAYFRKARNKGRVVLLRDWRIGKWRKIRTHVCRIAVTAGVLILAF